jgi:hypothetical protein
VINNYQKPRPVNYIVTNSGKQYTLTNLVPGVQPYSDRSYKLLKIPEELVGATLIQTANDDKTTFQQNLFSLKIDGRRQVIVYYIFDKRIIANKAPEWLAKKKQVKLSGELVSSDQATHYAYFTDTIQDKQLPLFFGSNQPFAGGKRYKKLESCSMYFVAISGVVPSHVVNLNISEDERRYFKVFVMGTDSLKLTQKLSDHEVWLKSGGEKGSRLDTLSGGIKNNVFFNGNLKQADLSRISISKTNFNSSSLKDVEFSRTTFTNVNFFNSQLDSANFNKAVIKDCSFLGADLTGSIFIGVKLKNVDFSCSDVAGVIFEPDSVTNVQGLAYAYGLDSITYRTDPRALIKLKEQLKLAGFTDAQRKVNAAIQRRKYEISTSWLTKAISYLLFDCTSSYGLYPFHPLIILFFAIYFFYKIYLLLFFTNKLEINIKHQKLTRASKLITVKDMIRPGSLLFLSIITSFSIGFGPYNINDWVKKLLKEEYTLESRGWTRVIMGVQNLVSLYLFSLTILLLFSDPFNY